ncbi:MAG: peptide-methionine (S)-S-oxide reductase, partial [Candidatus Puniceispirillaceae bacterium]
MFFTNPFKSRLPNADEALAGRASAILTPGTHAVHGRPIAPPFPDDVELVQLGLGCFWGAERLLWTQDGVYSTAVGYAGGQTPNPTYDEVCSGQTGHSEVVLVAFQPAILSFDA